MAHDVSVEETTIALAETEAIGGRYSPSVRQQGRVKMKMHSKLAPAIFAGTLLAVSHGAATAQTVAVATGAPGKVHLLPATMETTQLGWYDNPQKPVLTIKPGNSAIIEPMMHFHNRLSPPPPFDIL